MLSDHERRQWDALEAQLTSDRHRARGVEGRVAPMGRHADHRALAVVLAVTATVLMTAGHVLAFVPLSLLGGLALYLRVRR